MRILHIPDAKNPSPLKCGGRVLIPAEPENYRTALPEILIWRV